MSDRRGALLLALTQAESIVEFLDELALNSDEGSAEFQSLSDMHATAIDVWEYLHQLAHGEE